MDRDTSGNLLLDQPRLLLQDGGALGRGVFYTALMALGGLGGWGCFITAFDIDVHIPLLAVMGIICILFSVWRQLDSRKRWWSVSLLGWVAWLMLLVFRFDSVAHGAVRTVNSMLDCYGAKLNYDLPTLRLPYSVGVGKSDPAGECTSFIAQLFFPFFWSMARMWVRGRNNRAPFALTGVLLLLPMSFSILPGGWAFGLLLLFWCMLLLLAPSITGREGIVGHTRKKGYRASGVAAARPMALLLILAVGLCMWLVYLYAPLDTYERPELAESLRTGIREGFGSSRYLRGGQGNSNKEVRLNTLGSRSYTGETMLRVNFDWQEDPEGTSNPYYWETEWGYRAEVQEDGTNTPAANYYKEYLKSFVGSVYTGDSWERLDYEGREELRELELAAQNQIARYKGEMYAGGRDKPNWYHLSVQNLGANPRCVYIPNSLSSTQEELLDYRIEFVDDGYAKSGDFLSGTREYELDAQARTYGYNYFSRVAAYIAYQKYGINNLSTLGSSIVGVVNTDEYSGGVQLFSSNNLMSANGARSIKGSSALAELYESINRQNGAGGQGWPADLWKLERGEAWEFLSIEQQELLRAVEDYNEFVYGHYLDVPEELEGFLVDFREAYGLDPDGRIERGDFRFMDGVEFYASKIARVFQNYYTYTLDPAAPSEGQDFVEFFLDESHEGYCVHFASAAVLLLRSAGYPARYAEGYVVPSIQSGWMDVPDYNAHAWVEVYCGGTGWVPVEVTPAALDNPAAFFDATVPENPEEYIPTPRPETERPTMPPRRNPLIDEELDTPSAGPAASAEPSSGAGGSGAGAGGRKGPVWPAAAWCLGGAVAVWGALTLNRVLRIRKRERELGQRNKSEAGLRAYAYLLKLYEMEALCGVRGDPPERWKELAEKARFAKQTLSDEELGELTGDAERLAEKLRRQLPRGRRVWCWLTGLI